MKREDIDWSVIKGTLYGLVVSLVIASSLVGGSYYFEKEMGMDYTRNNTIFRSISQRYLAVDEEEKLIQTYYPKFLELYAAGVIGREQRLDWIEVLRSAGEELKIPSLSYEIQSQKIFIPSYGVDTGKYQIYMSNMKLNIRLSHEGELFRLFELLDRKAKGRYSISSCQLNNTAKFVMDNPLSANVTAECNLEWYTVKLSDGRDIEV